MSFWFGQKTGDVNGFGFLLVNVVKGEVFFHSNSATKYLDL